MHVAAHVHDGMPFIWRSAYFCGPKIGERLRFGGNIRACDHLLDRNDGLRLEGTFLREGYKTFPRESRIPADSVTFTPDGRFVDKGLMDAAGVMWPDASGRHINFDDGVPGTGTYRIANYTLELRYSDGRVKPVFFYLEPRTPKSSVREIYVNTYKFVRVK